MTQQLHHYVIESARRCPERVAVAERTRSTSYAELDRMANRAANYLEGQGVRQGDRVALWLEKSAWMLALMQGALRLGAVYVPIDPKNPAARVLKLCESAGPRLLVAPKEKIARLGPTLSASVWAEEDAALATDASEREVRDFGTDRLAYILFTSGSTGTPKGVCISHRNACAFVDWAVLELSLSPDDRLANHAPLHFDLSVLDLYGAFSCGASVHLIPEVMSFVPPSLTDFLISHEISVLYVVPSILSLLIDQGGLLEASPLRTLIFAGEPFSIGHLRQLRSAWPSTRLFNFYGPTETNVCLFHEVFEVEAGRLKPVPIGREACGDEVWAVCSDGARAKVGERGELVVRGPTVMLGYWGDSLAAGSSYATGDIVELLAGGGYEYVGRRDQMVKLRGQRVELGEIEAALQEFPGVRRCAAFVVGSGALAKLHALVVMDGALPSPLALRRHLAERLPPAWMIDHVEKVDDLPLTANGKLDRKAFQERFERSTE